MSPGPLFRCTSIAAPMTSALRRSAFSYNGCISDFYRKQTISRKLFLQKATKETRIGPESATLRCLRFLLLSFFSPRRSHTRRFFPEGNKGYGRSCIWDCSLPSFSSVSVFPYEPRPARGETFGVRRFLSVQTKASSRTRPTGRSEFS